MLRRRCRRTLGSMLAAFHICSQLNAGEGAHNSLRFSSGTSPSQSSTTFLYGPAGSVHSAPTSILICVFRLLMVCTPSQTRGSATTQIANSYCSRHQTRTPPHWSARQGKSEAQQQHRQAAETCHSRHQAGKGQCHWEFTQWHCREQDRPTACKVL